jgi:hypothetical protein
MRLVNDTVHATLAQFDFNSLRPFLNLLRQINIGTSFRDASLKLFGEEQGTTCFGVSRALLKSLKQEHGVEGSLAVNRDCLMHTFHHSAVVVECSDGFVFIESTYAPVLSSYPFGQVRPFGERYFMRASQPGSTIPLTLVLPSIEREHRMLPASTLEFCTNIANPEDLALKRYVIGCLWDPAQCIKIGRFDEDRRLRKFVSISLLQSKGILDTLDASGEHRTKDVSFHSILTGDGLREMMDFIGPRYCLSTPGLNTPLNILRQQVVEVVSQAERLTNLFHQPCFR